MDERRIGRVMSVDSFRVFIQIDDDLKSLYKSGFNDIYEIARINSYIIIPVGADKIVAIITRVQMRDETVFDKIHDSITLPQSQRYLVATMIGTIESNNEYLQGVYNFPTLDNPVWYITREDLNKIFDCKDAASIDYTKDYYLPIGNSPAFVDFQIKINPDQFFTKHAAILGNTGSGKSCTLASIIQNLFSYEFKINNQTKKLENAHFIIFDISGEFKQAFSGKQYVDTARVNALHIDQEGLKVPYWFMNYDDFEFLFKPSAGTQSPILKRAIGLAKDSTDANEKRLIPQAHLSLIQSIIDLCNNQQEDWKLKNKIHYEFESIVKDFKELNRKIDYQLDEIIKFLQSLCNQKINLRIEKGYIKGHVALNTISDACENLQQELNKYYQFISGKKISQDKNIDLPIWFNYSDLITKYIDDAIDEQEGSNNKISEFLSTLKLRLQSFLNDERIANPLMLNKPENFNNSLAIFLAFILGDLFKLCNNKSKADIFSKYYEDKSHKKDKPNQISILDMSLLPYEVLETVTGLIGRLVIEFLSRMSRINPKLRGKFPIVIVLEEAQNYIPEKDRGERVSIAKKVFERIAREGRKYGISLIISSQRPSELSKTVLSQCNSFIIHRLQNPEDQRYVKQLVSSANEDILQQLPVLPQQHAIVLGDCVRTPVQVKINQVDSKPNSDNPEFINSWLKEIDKNFPDYKAISKNWERRK